MSDIALLDLLAPYFLLGVELTPAQHLLLGLLRVEAYDDASDEDAVVLLGTARFNGHLDQLQLTSPTPGSVQLDVAGGTSSGGDAHPDLPRGAWLDFHDDAVDFRLTVPRSPSANVATAERSVSDPAVTHLLDALGPATAPTDRAGTAFRIDLLLTLLTVHLPFARGATLRPNGLLVADPARTDVKVKLPRVLLTLAGNDADLDLILDSWGATGLDDDPDAAVAELVEMEPPYALVGTGSTFGFGFRSAVLDLSDDHTPPDVLAQFGLGEDWQGIFLPDVRIFVAPAGVEGLALDAGARNLLIGLGATSGVWGDFFVDVVNQGHGMDIGLRIYDAQGRTYAIVPSTEGHVSARLPADTTFVVDLQNAHPPYAVTIDGANATGDQRHAVHLDGSRPVVVSATDSHTPAQTRTVTVDATLVPSTGAFPGGTPAGATATVPDAVLDPPQPESGGRRIVLLPGQTPTTVSLELVPADGTLTATGGSVTSVGGGRWTVAAPAGTRVTLHAEWAGDAANAEKRLDAFFHFDEPSRAHDPVATTAYVDDPASTGESAASSRDLTAPWRGGRNLTDSDAWRAWIADVSRASGTVTVEGWASFEVANPNNHDYNRALSLRRAAGLRALLASRGVPEASLQTPVPHGDDDATADAAGSAADPTPGVLYDSNAYWHARARYQLATAAPGTTLAAALTRARPSDPPAPRPDGGVVDPPTGRPSRPDFFKEVHVVLRLADSRFIAFELKGRVDFDTATEQRTQAAIARAGGTSVEQQLPRAGSSDGVTDFDFILSHDDSRQEWREDLRVSAVEEDTDGLFSVVPGSGDHVGWDFLGTMIVLAPLLSSAAGAMGGGVAGQVESLAVDVAVPYAIAKFAHVHTRLIVLHGVELVARERASGSADASLLFDIETALDFKVSLLGTDLLWTKRDHPLKVRYKAVGIRTDFSPDPSQPARPALRPVFDASKGYTIDVSDVGMFELPAPLGDLLQVLGARMARTNPLSLEVDLGLSADLGIISVDKASVRMPLDPVGVPSITALGASVDIAGAFSGRGYLAIDDAGIIGQLDLALTGLGIRISGGVAIGHASEGGREATAVAVTLAVEFPVPIVLGTSGLGIYGFLGLFAMHYARRENPSATMAPALDWFVNVAHGNAADLAAWRPPKLDHWGFGVGAVLGTLEGGHVLNLKGVLLLELPGPRLLLFMNASLLSVERPPTEGAAMGLLQAVIDLDFGRGTMLIGIAVEYEDLKPLVEVRIPAQAFFDFADPSNFALDIGSIASPATVTVFDLFSASGYLEIHGNGIPDFAGGPLAGFAVAAGVKVSYTWGDTGVGLYLRVHASIDVGVTFSPLHLIGKLELGGELHLFIIGIEASGSLDVEATTGKARIEGAVHGKVDFFFFSVEGSVHMALGTQPDKPPAPPLVRGMSLLSRSPALVQGSGTDRPIDASLGDALPEGSTDPLPIVPVDAIPLLALEAPALLGPSFSGTCESPGNAPGIAGDGWVTRGPNRVKYVIDAIHLTPAPGSGARPSVWVRAGGGGGAADSAAALALLSWEPTATPKAVERSTVLDNQVDREWGSVCDPVTPARPVVWTFADKPVGPSASGWQLTGIALRDPPGAPPRSAPVPLGAQVSEAWRTGDPVADAFADLIPARVVGGIVPGAGTEAALMVDRRRVEARILEAPFTDLRKPPRHDDELARLLEGAGETDGLIDGTVLRIDGGIDSVRMLVGASEHVVGGEVLRLRMLAGDGSVLDDMPVEGSTVSTLDDLPGEWAQPAWASTAMPSAALLLRLAGHEDRRGMTALLVDAEVSEGTVALELGLDPGKLDADRQELVAPPSFLVGVLEAQLSDEVRRAAWDETQRKHHVDVINGALAADPANRALLARDTTYSVRVDYRSAIRIGSDTTTDAPAEGAGQASQVFRFHTHAEPPTRLDPWMLATAPTAGEAFHFYAEPLVLVFSTDDLTQLLAMYGRTLRARARAASFKPHPSSPLSAQMTVPLTAAALEALAPMVTGPWEAAVRDRLGGTDCVDTSGTSSRHQRVTLSMPLEPFTDYVLDLEYQPPLESPLLNPLFRTAFTTSRYPDLAAFARELAITRPASRHVDAAPLAALRALPDVAPAAVLDDALRGAGLDAIAAVEEPQVVVLWDGGAPPQPVAVVLAMPEPLWRFRDEPAPANVPQPNPLGVQRWALAPRAWLGLRERSPHIVGRIARDVRGARAVLLLGADARGQLLDLVLDRSVSPLLDPGVAPSQPAALTLTLSRAPWEDAP